MMTLPSVLTSFTTFTPFRDAHLKIHRAKKHVSDFEGTLVAVEESCVSKVEQNRRTGGETLTHTISNFEVRSLMLSLIIGDAIHNLHSAIDFAWGSAIQKHVPAAKSDYTKFPVRKTKAEVEAALRGISVDTASRKLFNFIVEDIQPFSGGSNDLIYALHDFDISDKHLLLLDLTTRSGISGIVVRSQDGELVHGSAVPIQGFGPYPIDFEKGIHVEKHGKLNVEIAIKDAGIFEGLAVRDLLPMFSQQVEYTVKTLEILSK